MHVAGARSSIVAFEHLDDPADGSPDRGETNPEVSGNLYSTVAHAALMVVSRSGCIATDIESPHRHLPPIGEAADALTDHGRQRVTSVCASRESGMHGSQGLRLIHAQRRRRQVQSR